MIRNLVFDVGNVLTRWDPRLLASRLFPSDPAMAEFVREKGFCDPLWFQGDEGTTTMERLALEMAKGCDRVHQEAMVYAMTHFPTVLEPIPEVIALLKEYKTAGYGCYLLSNYCELFEESIRYIGVLDAVDGYVYSHKEKTIKPKRDIYEILLQRYHLNPQECVFIDDKARNVEAALQAGFGYGFVFTGDADALKEYLRLNA